MWRVVMVCSGNICRSPMAAGLLRHTWQARAGNGLAVSSMGTLGLAGQPATPEAVRACAERDVDIAAHRSRGLIGEELHRAGLILVMEPAHRRLLTLYFPALAGRTNLLGAWPRSTVRGCAVADPMGRSLSYYRRICGQIARHVARIVPALREAAW